MLELCDLLKSWIICLVFIEYFYGYTLLQALLLSLMLIFIVVFHRFRRWFVFLYYIQLCWIVDIFYKYICQSNHCISTLLTIAICIKFEGMCPLYICTKYSNNVVHGRTPWEPFLVRTHLELRLSCVHSSSLSKCAWIFFFHINIYIIF